MAQLAIKGHATRGKEIIEILEMLGGKNQNNVYTGKDTFHYYFIDNETGYIRTKLYSDDCWAKLTDNHFTLEEFLEKFPYKVGDKVLYYENPVFITQMEWIEDSVSYHFYYKGRELMLPVNHLQPYKEETMEEEEENFGECIEKTIQECLFGKKEIMKEIKIDIPRGYEFSGVCNQQMVFTRIQPQYPKTYEECCRILDTHPNTDYVEGYKWKLIMNFQKLLVCRDAYWKIAGEQMELGKPWEPDWVNAIYTCTIICRSNKIIKDAGFDADNRILAFPTEEMRDAFYKNFKDLIEQCKELL